MNAVWVGYAFAFFLGMAVMGVSILLYMHHLNKKLEFEVKLQLVASGEDPQQVDDMFKDMEKWWKNIT